MRSDERGVSMSVFACGAIMALLILAGLVVDGTAQLMARERAQGAAAQIARWATDASVPYQVDGSDGRNVALTAARTAAANYPDLNFDITMDQAGVLHITGTKQVNTVFLQLIGVSSLPATGMASAVVIRP
ncbi:MAG: pilus assembly protein TadG-related protein [Propionibacteriaceae bacterium]|nr:pilus assembly protein TadG-related protein [Propionibacteriaceae bacterium]